MEFDEEAINTVKGEEYTEELNSDFLVKPFQNKGRNTSVFFLNKEVQRAKFQK